MHIVYVSLRLYNRQLSESDLKISQACLTSVASVWQGLTGCVKNECNATGFALYEQLQGIQIALCVSLRSATNQETSILDHTQREAPICRTPTPANWKKQHHVEDLRAGTRTPLVFAYRRIAKHVIHLRQVYPDIAGILPAVRRGRQATTSAPPRLWYIVLH